MKQPQLGFTPPDFSGQSQTMFFVEGQTAAVLVKRRGNRMSQRAVPHKTPAAALAWCQANRTTFVFMPSVACLN